MIYQGISACTLREPVHYYTSVDEGKRFETSSTGNGYEPFCSVDRPLEKHILLPYNSLH